MDKKYDFCGIGNAAIDVICEVPDRFLGEQNIPRCSCAFPDQTGVDALEQAFIDQKIDLTLEGGGSSANTSVVVGAIGGKAAFLGKTTDDDYGQRFDASMSRWGVVCPVAPMAAGGAPTTRIYTFITPDKERTFANFPGSATTFTSAELPEDVIAASRCFCVDGYALALPNVAQVCMDALDIAEKHDVLRVFNPSAPSVVENWPELVDVCMARAQGVICNQGEAVALTGEVEPKAALEILAEGREFAVITLAEQGAMAIANGQYCCLPNVEVPAALVNTNGAGDAFAGGFLYAYVNEYPLESCVKLGMLCAVNVVTQTGARPTYDLRHVLDEIK